MTRHFCDTIGRKVGNQERIQGIKVAVGEKRSDSEKPVLAAIYARASRNQKFERPQPMLEVLPRKRMDRKVRACR